MSRYVMNFYTRCTDPAREDEFNSWYSHVHVPELACVEGVTDARRYICTDPRCEAKYLAVYELETKDLAESMKRFFSIVRSSFESGRHIDCVESATTVNTPLVGIYKEMLPDEVARLPLREYPKRVPAALSELAGPDDCDDHCNHA
jgi:hypothetical protein